MTADSFTLWQEGRWYCVLSAGEGTPARVELWTNRDLVAAQTLPDRSQAMSYAEVLRQRVLHGELQTYNERMKPHCELTVWRTGERRCEMWMIDGAACLRLYDGDTLVLQERTERGRAYQQAQELRMRGAAK